MTLFPSPMTHYTKKIAITGAQGFLGAEFLRFIASKYSDFCIHALSEPNQFHGLKNVSVYPARLGVNKLPEKFLEGCEIVFHFAYHGFPSESPVSPEKEILANMNATTELFETMRKQKCNRLVLLGSGGAIYAREDDNFQSEMTPIECRSAYATGKLCNELLADMNHHLFGIQTYKLRVSNVYGPGQNARVQNGFIAKAFQCILDSSEMPLWVNPRTRKDFIYTTDLFSALEKVLFSTDIPSGTYNIGGNKSYSLHDVINVIEKVAGTRLKTVGQSNKSDLSNFTCLDTGKFQSFVGWEPTTDLENGVRQFWNWYRDTHAPARKAA